MAVMAVTSVLLSCATVSVVAYRETLVHLQQELKLELHEQQQFRAELLEELDAFEAAGGDVPLFGNMRRGNFARAARLLDEDPTSVLHRLKAGFREGQNMVVVGAGGVGKTETIKLAMEDLRKSKASFDLRSWYMEQVGMTKENRGDYVKGYGADGKSRVKEEQLQLLHAREREIKTDISEKRADILFFDEVDLGAGFLNQDELDAMKLLLQWGNELAPSKAKVVVLHPLVSIQPAVHTVLSEAGFPSPGDATWIDFSQPYKKVQQEAMIEGILASTVGEDDVTDEIVDYFMGMPNAYLPFLINKGNILDMLAGKPKEEAADIMRSTAMNQVGGKLIKINIGFQASEEARAAIKALLVNPHAEVQDSAGLGAVAAMAVQKGRQGYYIPRLMREGFFDYCRDASDKDKAAVRPICD